MSSHHSFTAADGKKIHYQKWIPQGKPAAVIQIAHGMMEHIGKYDQFAEFLTGIGYAVVGDDHRGHGKTIEKPEEQGFLTDKNGWFRTAEDLIGLRGIIEQEFPRLPIILFGHSMGSFLARTIAILHPAAYSGMICSGTSASQGLLGAAGRVAAEIGALLFGNRKPAQFLDTLAFEPYRKQFSPRRTEFEWLSRDSAEVDAYVEDPLCGFVCSYKFFSDLSFGIAFINRRDPVSRMRKDLPILMISGEEDPVGGRGKGIEQVFSRFISAGLTDVTMKLYPEGRHALLSDICRDEVESDISGWLSGVLEELPKDQSRERKSAAGTGGLWRNRTGL